MKYSIFNRTDGIFASIEEFDSREETEEEIKRFRERFSIQGYYKTSSGLRISPEEVELEIQGN